MNLKSAVLAIAVSGLVVAPGSAALARAQTNAAGALRPAEVIQRALPGTVLIETRTVDGRDGVASGFLIDPSGIVVTNFHVIRDAVSAKVSLQSGDTFSRVTVRALDEAKDIAILQIPGFNLPIVPLGDSEHIKQGDAVVLLGSPLGLNGTATTGIVSAIRQMDGYRAFQTDAAANPGNSGGPMLNQHGEAVGILAFGLKDGQGLNFVVPINYARGLVGVDDALSLADVARRPTSDNSSDGAWRTETGRTASTGRTPLLEATYRHPQGARVLIQQRQDGLVLTFYRSDSSSYGNASLSWQSARDGFVGFAELVYLCGSFDTRTTTVKSELEIFVEAGGTLRMRYQVPNGINCTRNRVRGFTWGEDRWYPGR